MHLCLSSLGCDCSYIEFAFENTPYTCIDGDCDGGVLCRWFSKCKDAPILALTRKDFEERNKTELGVRQLWVRIESTQLKNAPFEPVHRITESTENTTNGTDNSTDASTGHSTLDTSNDNSTNDTANKTVTGLNSTVTQFMNSENTFKSFNPTTSTNVNITPLQFLTGNIIKSIPQTTTTNGDCRMSNGNECCHAWDKNITNGYWSQNLNKCDIKSCTRLQVVQLNITSGLERLEKISAHKEINEKLFGSDVMNYMRRFKKENKDYIILKSESDFYLGNRSSTVSTGLKNNYNSTDSSTINYTKFQKGLLEILLKRKSRECQNLCREDSNCQWAVFLPYFKVRRYFAKCIMYDFCPNINVMKPGSLANTTILTINTADNATVTNESIKYVKGGGNSLSLYNYLNSSENQNGSQTLSREEEQYQGSQVFFVPGKKIEAQAAASSTVSLAPNTVCNSEESRHSAESSVNRVSLNECMLTCRGLSDCNWISWIPRKTSKASGNEGI